MTGPIADAIPAVLPMLRLLRDDSVTGRVITYRSYVTAAMEDGVSVAQYTDYELIKVSKTKHSRRSAYVLRSMVEAGDPIFILLNEDLDVVPSESDLIVEGAITYKVVNFDEIPTLGWVLTAKGLG